MTRRMKLFGSLACLAVLFVSFLACCYLCYNYDECISITVYGKEKVAQAPGRPKPFRYIVYIGTDTLELVDSAALMKFDSDATFNRLEVGKKYNVHIAAWHWQMFSHHRAILKVD